jgi:hypothetical protein
MRWDAQALVPAPAEETSGPAPALLPLAGLVRSVTTPEFAGITFHEVTAKSVLNKVPAGSRMPFEWTVNPYRGCSHACVYCFARKSHTYLDFDAGLDFDSQVVVKVNAAEVPTRIHTSVRRAGTGSCRGSSPPLRIPVHPCPS